MKIRVLTYIAAFALAGHLALAQTDTASLLAEAAENTFEDKNYSWRTVTTLPDGAVHETIGAKAGNNTLITRSVAGQRPQVLLTVGEKRFVQTEAGWQSAPDVVFHAKGPDRPIERPIRMSVARGGPFGDPGEHFDRLIERVAEWSVTGNLFVGTFEGAAFGPARGHGNASRVRRNAQTNHRPSDVATTLAVQVTNGVIVTLTSTMKGQITAPGEIAKEVTHTSATTISAIGSTAVIIPADVEALLSSG